jgi:hypothetical protein
MEFFIKERKLVRTYWGTCSVAEPHHFYAAPGPDENFDAAPAPAPTLLYSKAKFLERTKVYTYFVYMLKI